MYPELETKVYNLEEILGEFIISTNQMMDRADKRSDRADKRMDRLEENLDKTITEMKEDTAKMKEDTAKMKEGIKSENKKANKKWGDLANKMGTIVEDIIEPSMNSVIKKYFNIEVTESTIHLKKKIKSLVLQGEYDIVAVGENKVFVVEVKSTPDKKKLLHFKNNSLPKFKKLFPQYKDLELIPLFGGIRLDPELIEFATKEKIFTIAYREWDYVDILNFDELIDSYL